MADLSIIVVSYKGHERLRSCLESINSFSGKEIKTEVVVVNNCPGDMDFHLIEMQFPGFTYIHNAENGGYANGCNLGVSYAKGSYLLILNPDTVVTEDAVVQLISTAKSYSELIITSCRQVNEKGKESVAWGQFPGIKNLTGFIRALSGNSYRSQVIHKKGYPYNIFFPDWISGSALLLTNNTYKRLKGFDDDFWMYFEDVDICMRARNLGGEIAFCTDIKIEHNHGGSSRINKVTTSLTKTEVYISRHVYFSKHKAGLEVILIQLFLVINNLISSGIVALAGIIFFFIPKLHLRTLVFLNLITYYSGALSRGTWKSPRSVNYTRSHSGIR